MRGPPSSKSPQMAAWALSQLLSLPANGGRTSGSVYCPATWCPGSRRAQMRGPPSSKAHRRPCGRRHSSFQPPVRGGRIAGSACCPAPMVVPGNASRRERGLPR
ncbi:hypothetical protein NDU88_001170 [Pleurodeles waltl]|uniref:Secreted protein n=1 Tax=Pleurodeles waltl TaxID=8319 RepID=A0AAV7UTI0_PLEWA|nr:hypothetical protein NDU88_001170 [Pleurodeles waltl]